VPLWCRHRIGRPASRQSSTDSATGHLVAFFSLFPKVAKAVAHRYSFAVKGMTRQEQLVVFAIIGLLLLGLAVKTWRTAHPPTPVVQKTH